MMSRLSIPKPSGPTPNARTIDLFWAGIASDGTKIYAPAGPGLSSWPGHRHASGKISPRNALRRNLGIGGGGLHLVDFVNSQRELRAGSAISLERRCRV